MMKYLLILPVLVLLSANVYSQVQDSTIQSIKNQTELNAEKSEESGDAAATAEQEMDFLEQLLQHPIDPNTASADEFQQIPSLDLEIAHRIVAYRRAHLFENLSELVKVKGIGKVTLRRIQPFLRISKSSLHRDPHFWTDGFRGRYLARFQQTLTPQKGYKPDSGKTGYLGGPAHAYQRLTLYNRHISLNITQDKDPGERWDGKLGFDYTSAHLAIFDVGILQRLVVGDYSLALGQGLGLRSGGSMGMGSAVISGALQNSRGLRPYTSSDENHFFRGFAATVGNRLSATLFFSKRQYSATIINGDTIAYPSFTGYYRTPTEFERRYDNGAILYGGHLGWQFSFGTIGVTAYQNHFDHYIAPDDRYYRINYFSGTDANLISLDYRFLWGNQIFFGEVARSGNNAYAVITGIRSRLAPNAELLVSWRNYDTRFQSIFGSALSQKSGNLQNEQGLYAGLRFQFSRKITFRTYFDQFFFPKPRYRVHTKSQGFEWLGVLDFDSRSGFSATVLGSYQTNGIDENTIDLWGRDIRFKGAQNRLRLRGQIEVSPEPHLRFRSRAEWVRYTAATINRSEGFLLYQDVRWHPFKTIRLDFRYCFFDTDDYNSRVYAFENDMLNVFHIPSFYGRGQRIYLLMKWSASKHIAIWGKLGLTRYIDRQTIGSGLNLINGNKKEDLGLMMRLTL